ncbi:hypothetical protein PVAP13_1KG446405 [Panicum virgatum]|uniref:Uncharacterized protein n=1 Tax=Panicum virgatum TaxID=38727 RepID=A0A8T0XZ61_PANVG|nr:hypothetical protein PVAP13_1KG446405 [Panicum virgatum]
MESYSAAYRWRSCPASRDGGLFIRFQLHKRRPLRWQCPATCARLPCPGVAVRGETRWPGHRHPHPRWTLVWAPHTLIPLTPRQAMARPGREKKSPITSSPSPTSPIATTCPPSVTASSAYYLPPWKRRVMESAGAGELSGTGGRFLMRTRRCTGSRSGSAATGI